MEFENDVWQSDYEVEFYFHGKPYKMNLARELIEDLAYMGDDVVNEITQLVLNELDVKTGPLETELQILALKRVIRNRIPHLPKQSRTKKFLKRLWK